MTRRFTNTHKDRHCVRHCGQIHSAKGLLSVFPFVNSFAECPIILCPDGGPVCPACFHNINVLGTLHRLAWIVSLGYEQTVWVMRQVGKDSAMKEKRRKALFLAFRMELGHKGDLVNHASFVIRMVEDNYFVLCLI